MNDSKMPGTAGPGDLKQAAEAAWFMPEQMERRPIAELVPYARNARTHSDAQIAQLRASIREFGFVNPVLIDGDGNIIAGHGRVLAAQAEGMTEVPCVLVEHLSDTQRRAYILADNRLAEAAGWDMEMVALELGELKATDLDLQLTGFPVADLDLHSAAPVPAADGGTRDAHRAPQPQTACPAAGPDSNTATSCQDTDALQRAFEAGMASAEAGEDSDEYLAFVEKFTPKRTTDDCYTPAPVYDAAKAWAVQKYSLSGRPVVRPFYPGGDYKKLTYPDGAVVLDNPPFSILAEIIDFYLLHHIDFFLFAPWLTTMGYLSRKGVHAVITHAAVIYENGASVNTCFVTSLGEVAVTVSPELHDAIELASMQAENDRNPRRALPKYSYPDEVATAAGLGYLASHGISLEIPAESCTFIRALASQRECGKAIFGAGLLLSKKAAAEKAAAEKAAAEKAAATRWPLSEREREIIDGLK